MSAAPSSEQSKALLTIRGLRVEARIDDGWKELVHGVDLDLKAGEVLGLIGESGAGKSTIGLAAIGYTRAGLRISGGSVVFDGLDLAKASDVQRRSVRGLSAAYVAQSAAASFNPAHRIIDQCVEVPFVTAKTPLNDAKAIVVDLFRRLLMPEPDRIGERFPHQLSGGQLQRAMTAMAMAPSPKIIVFDEPTTALDVTTQVEVLASIRASVRDLGLAALYISHDLAVVAQIADRILVLRNGKMVEQGDTAETLAKPQQEYTRRLISVRQFRREKHKTDSEVAVRITGVSAKYGSKTALDNVSLDVCRGETVAIVGESGSGKTTAARAIAGLLRPTSGHVELAGKVLPADYAARSPDELRNIQFIHQMPDTALNPQQTVRKLLGRVFQFYFRLSDSELDGRLNRLLEMLELDPAEILERRPSELSGGQKQRVCIARALAADPLVVICDEVTSALDPLVAEEIIKLLARLQRQTNQAYIFITHDIATVRAIADRVAVMKSGKIVEFGARDEILDRSSHPYTKLLIDSTPVMDVGWLDGILAGGPNSALKFSETAKTVSRA